jgi:hypothetical protein
MDDVLVYMDCCCFNRVNDDQTQDKIRIESDAIIAILLKCLYGPWKLIGSDVIEYEIMKTPDQNKKNRALELYKIKKENIFLTDALVERAREIQRYGIKPIDSLHFASAEYGNVTVLLTVDREFMRNSKQIGSSLRMENPTRWFMEEIEND